jgi:hypothetical protein
MLDYSVIFLIIAALADVGALILGAVTVYGLWDTYYSMSRARHWCFTLNNYSQQDVDRLLDLGEQVDYIIFGREVAETGTRHLQGFVSFPNRKRLNQVKHICGQAHYTVARHVQRSIEYCKKDGDFEERGDPPAGSGQRSDLDMFKDDVKNGNLNMSELREMHSDVFARYPGFCLAYINDHVPVPDIEAHPLRAWQEELNARLNGPADSRSIVFVVDSVGNSGKSWFAHYYASLHENVQVLQPAKKADMAFALQPLLRVLFIDAPRSKQGEFIQYDFLEDLKNGFVFSTKYESRVKRYPHLHVVVLMNEMPDLTKLSEDRYVIINLDGEI